MMRQKAKVRWLELVDRNTAYFFSTLKKRHNRNVIGYLTQGMVQCWRTLLILKVRWLGISDLSSLLLKVCEN